MTNLYSVSYNVNNATGGSTPPTQMAESNSDTYTFITPAAQEYGLIKTNHGFAGWSKNPNATTPEYKAGSTIILSNTSPNITLYAVWINLSPVTSWDELKYMQQMSPSACSGGNETGKQLIDFRDGKSYWVAKLKDDNCWMTQNLDYDDPNSIRITSTSGTSGGPSSDWSSNNDVRQYWDPGEKIISGSTLTAATDSTDRHLLVGNYYSWLSATIGTGKDISTDGANASGSICPDGWKLPTSTASGQFQLLVNQGKSSYTQYPSTNINGYWLGGTTANASGAAFFAANGRVYGGKLDNAGSTGFYWSSTAYSGTNAYNLFFNSSSVTPSNNANRYHGLSVRCVAR